MFLRDYQTGFAMTLGFCLLILGGFALGVFDTLHHHALNGWIEITVWALIAFNFHHRFHKKSESN